MKKLLSIILVVAMMMSVSVMATSAANADVAETSANYQFSSKPYENVSGSGVTVYGYLGDADGDKDISVMDATEIQLYCAKLSSLSNNALIVSDTDADGEISVMDATEVQLWAASLPANELISHTVYTVTVSGPSTFSTIANYIKSVGVKEGEEYFEYAIYDTCYEDNNHYYRAFTYKPNSNEISLYTSEDIDDDNNVTTLITIKEDSKEFTFLTYSGNREVADYDAWGFATLTSVNPDKFSINCPIFSSDKGYTFEYVSSDIINNFTHTFDCANNVLGGYDIRAILK